MGEVGCCVTALVCCVDVHGAGVGRLGQLGLAGLFFFSFFHSSLVSFE
jgi:hypothetical protein